MTKEPDLSSAAVGNDIWRRVKGVLKPRYLHGIYVVFALLTRKVTWRYARFAMPHARSPAREHGRAKQNHHSDRSPNYSRL